ncbi:MAG: methyltransferase domain-containing protein [Planctomycetes bacterium]|nr:methyltransferase domain-containing protein [Planctomycetota bacterium]
MAGATWNPDLYDGRHAFVWKLTDEVLSLLAAEPEERIIDLGCGTGHLTQRISERGAEVVGVDASETMVAKARAAYPGLRFVLADAARLDLGTDFDAVFSNAALHWMRDQQRVFERVHAHLRPKGRFVFEMGGAGNLAAVSEAVGLALREEGAPLAAIGEKNRYLSLNRACALLDRAGFEVATATLTERPTPLEGELGLRSWIEMFGGVWLQWVEAARREEFLARVEHHARPRLFREGRWIADYRRLRVQALRRD